MLGSVRERSRWGAAVLPAALALAALWPALLSGGALWFADLAPYVRGGHVAIETVAEAFAADRPDAADAAAGPGGLAAASEAPVSGVRSIAYSVTAEIAARLTPRFWGLVMLQAVALSFLVTALARREGGPGWAWAAAVALGTGSVAASTAGPDVWAGLLILGLLLLVRHGPRLRRAETAATLAILAFAVAAHASHILLALVLGAAAWAWPRGRSVRAGGGRLAALGLLGGIAAVLLASLIGFGEASLAPKRYPIVLARAIEDGPALWHLEEGCEEHGYAVCEVFPEGVPDDVGSFLWAEDGLRARATPAQMERVRAEEALILRRAAAEYPLAQARAALANLVRQVGMISQAPSLGRVAVLEGPGRAVAGGEVRWSAARRLSILSQSVLFGAAAAFLLGAAGLTLVTRRWRPEEVRLVGLAVAGLLANAAICGVLSVPTERYQARVAWVLPLVALAVAPRVIPRSGR